MPVFQPNITAFQIQIALRNIFIFVRILLLHFAGILHRSIIVNKWRRNHFDGILAQGFGSGATQFMQVNFDGMPFSSPTTLFHHFCRIHAIKRNGVHSVNNPNTTKHTKECFSSVSREFSNKKNRKYACVFSVSINIFPNQWPNGRFVMISNGTMWWKYRLYKEECMFDSVVCDNWKSNVRSIFVEFSDSLSMKTTQFS